VRAVNVPEPHGLFGSAVPTPYASPLGKFPKPNATVSIFGFFSGKISIIYIVEAVEQVHYIARAT
jgi:hypothetical protein